MLKPLIIPQLNQMMRGMIVRPGAAGGGAPAGLTLVDWKLSTVTTGNTIAVAAPDAGVDAGDLLVTLSQYENNTPHTAPAGWARAVFGGANGTNACLCWRTATGGETSVTLTASLSHAQVAVMLRFTGANAAPVGASQQTSVASSSSPQAISGLTTTADNSFVLGFGGWDAFNTNQETVILQNNNGWTVGDALYTPNGSFAAGLAWGYKQVPTAGASQSVNALNGGGTDGFFGYQVEILQA